MEKLKIKMKNLKKIILARTFQEIKKTGFGRFFETM